MIKTTGPKYGHVDDAKACIKGCSSMKGFVFGYVTKQKRPVIFFDINTDGYPIPLKGQEHITHWTLASENQDA